MGVIGLELFGIFEIDGKNRLIVALPCKDELAGSVIRQTVFPGYNGEDHGAVSDQRFNRRIIWIITRNQAIIVPDPEALLLQHCQDLCGGMIIFVRIAEKDKWLAIKNSRYRCHNFIFLLNMPVLQRKHPLFQYNRL